MGIGAFEEAEGFAKGSLLELLFGETHYIGVEGRAVAAEAASETIDAVAADPDALTASGELADEPDWHLLEKGQIEVATYFERMVEKAPGVLGKPLDMDAYGRFWRTTSPGVHWMVVHKMRELKERGFQLGLLTNNVKEFGEHWRATFPIELFDEVVDSSHVGMRKPERAIYELTCERLCDRAERSGVHRRQRRQHRGGARVRHGGRALRHRAVGSAGRARRDPRPARCQHGVSTCVRATDQSSTRCTVSGAKAGRHTAMYSAPSGVEYCTVSPPCAMTA